MAGLDVEELVRVIDQSWGMCWDETSCLYVATTDGGVIDVPLPGPPNMLLPGLVLPEACSTVVLMSQGWGFVAHDQEGVELTIPESFQMRVVTAVSSDGRSVMLEHYQEGLCVVTVSGQDGSRIEGLIPKLLSLLVGIRRDEDPFPTDIVASVLWLDALVRIGDAVGTDSDVIISAALCSGPEAVVGDQGSFGEAVAGIVRRDQPMSWDRLRIAYAASLYELGIEYQARAISWGDGEWFAGEFLAPFLPIEELLARLERVGGDGVLERFREALKREQLPML